MAKRKLTRSQKQARRAQEAERDAIGLNVFADLARKAGFSVLAESEDGTVALAGLSQRDS